MISLKQAAAELKIKPATVLAYLYNGNLTGDKDTGEVDADSLEKYKASQLASQASKLEAIKAALEIDDGLTDKQRGFVRTPGKRQRLPETGLTDRERDVLQRRAQGEIAKSIGRVHNISRQMVHSIIKRAVDRMTNLKESESGNL